MRILTVDPGIRATGLAEHTGRKLTKAELIRPTDSTRYAPSPGFDGPDLPAIEAVCELAAQWLIWRVRLLDYPPVSVIAFEWPTVYGDASEREEDPNDLLLLTAINLGILGHLRQAGITLPARLVLARLWTKGTPKRIRQARYLSKITPAEKAILDAIKPAGLRHNTIDAANMGRVVTDALG